MTDDDDLRLILIGKTGSGKSSTGNSILKIRGNFKSSASASSVTARATSKVCDHNGRRVLVVDTPGAFDTGSPEASIQREILKSLSVASPGPHVLVMVMKIGRFTQEERDAVAYFEKLFRENFYKYLIVVFTGKDGLECEGQTMEEYVSRSPKELRDILSRAKNRFFPINNRETDPSKRNKQVSELLSMVDDLRWFNNGNYFNTNRYFSEEERRRKLLQ